MARQFDAVATEIGLTEAQPVGLTPYEIVIVASLIQEEYGIVEEMPQIARVIYNRLDNGEPLGIDATSRYEPQQAVQLAHAVDLEATRPTTPASTPGCRRRRSPRRAGRRSRRR